MNFKKIVAFLAPKLALCIVILGIILNPKSSMLAAKNGISIWINILMPSLLPFIIGANLIISLKVVDLLGVLINPITKVLFNVSGKSGVIFAISMVSGYPVGTKFASDLRLQNKISKSEGQRLISFCSTSGPLFIIGSVGTIMLNSPNIGYLMLICHYLGAISVGLVFRNYGDKSKLSTNMSISKNFKDLICNDSKSDDFSILFGNAVINGVNTLLAIGGFVIIFSVFFEILSFFKIIDFLSFLLCILLKNFNITSDICKAFIKGIFEITIGCNSLSQINNSSSILLISLCSFLIGFSGLSILAQCCSFIGKTDLKIKFYVIAKLLHGTFAFLFTYIFLLFNKSYLVSNFEGFNKISYYGYYNLYSDNFTPILIVIIIIYLFTYLRKLLDS